jgi:hemerythrin
MVACMKTCRGFFGRVPMMQHTLAGLVHWRAEFSTGDNAIDIQDRAIFNLVGEIDDVWRHGASVAQVRDLAARARRLLDAHFVREERLLAEIGYPYRAQHAAEHRELLADLAAIRVDLDRDDDAHAGRAGLQLCNFLLGVVLGHMANTDSDYCAYIADETARLSTGSA